MCVCVCAPACVRACVRACVCVYAREAPRHTRTLKHRRAWRRFLFKTIDPPLQMPTSAGPLEAVPNGVAWVRGVPRPIVVARLVPHPVVRPVVRLLVAPVGRQPIGRGAKSTVLHELVLDILPMWRMVGRQREGGHEVTGQAKGGEGGEREASGARRRR